MAVCLLYCQVPYLLPIPCFPCQTNLHFQLGFILALSSFYQLLTNKISKKDRNFRLQRSQVPNHGHIFSLEFTYFLWYFRRLTTYSFSYFLSHILLLLQKILQSVFLQGRKRKIDIELPDKRKHAAEVLT